MKPGRLLLTVLMGALVAACGTPPDESQTPSPIPATMPNSVSPSPVPTAQVSGAPAATPAPQPTPPPVAADPPPLALSPVVSGLSSPINITATPDGWLLVNERSGRIVAVYPENGETAVTLDISDRVLGQGEQGLLGLALHPAWRGEDLRAFVHYTDRAGDTVLAEFSMTDFALPPRLDPATERVLLRVDQPYANHNGGQLAFGPDGMLYLGLGDGGSGGDPQGNGQDPGTLLGTILRLDVSQPGVARAPDDAPFADGDGAPEVHLFGLRNPWRFSFDRLTGDLWIADVGQNAYEEVNRVDPTADAGGNLGWNVTEASHCFADANCDTRAFIGPVSEYGRELGCSITGGFVYRGESIPDLRGWYLFGDYCGGTIFGVRSDVEELTPPRVLLETDAAISSFGEDVEGELYLADLRGAIYRIVEGD